MSYVRRIKQKSSVSRKLGAVKLHYFFNHCVLQRGCNVIQTKLVTVRIPENLLEHCQHRIKELSLQYDMDMSKFVRWLIRNDSLSSAKDNVIQRRTVTELKENMPSCSVIQPEKPAPEQQKNQPEKLVWKL
ncbi:MAG TPA: hypothetical protein DIW31_06115 [Bacteroidales bacterium]|nr:hypothetical protein [Bacteroidales bacterium]